MAIAIAPGPSTGSEQQQLFSSQLELKTPVGSRRKTVQLNPTTEQHEVLRNASLILSLGARPAEAAAVPSTSLASAVGGGGGPCAQPRILTLCVQHADPKFHMANKITNCGDESHTNKSDGKKLHVCIREAV